MPGLTGPKRVHVWVSGRVQNVWFRDQCRQEASARGVTGWVRNLPDRRVEAVFEGSPEAVDALVTWCHDGPPRARVAGVEAQEETPVGEDQGFSIR
jgi:acylphosphatase